MIPARSYEIRIRGRIPPDELEEFKGPPIQRHRANGDRPTQIRDQAALQGVLTRLHRTRARTS